jgi:hypothetical protein
MRVSYLQKKDCKKLTLNKYEKSSSIELSLSESDNFDYWISY